MPRGKRRNLLRRKDLRPRPVPAGQCLECAYAGVPLSISVKVCRDCQRLSRKVGGSS